MKHLYLAGPYTKPDPIINTHAACKVASILFERELYVPHVPHLTLLWHMVDPHPVEWWYSLDLMHMDRCEAFCRLPGESTGADNEQNYASAIGLDWVPFNSLPTQAIRAWIDRDVLHADPVGQ